ncbi:hypothetical protein YQE_12859, partial [Dendroctonus ponderosae]
MSLVKRKKLESKKKGKTELPKLVTDYCAMMICSLDTYEKVFKESIENPESFWASVGTMVSWAKPWKKVLDNSQEPFTKWYVGGEINACYNAVDRHVEAGNGSKVALIYDSPGTGVVRKISYSELQEKKSLHRLHWLFSLKVSKLAGLLARYGVEKGDKVLIYMPLIPETVMAMLAVARLGAVHSVVFGGFAASELSTRINHAEPKVIIAASCGIEPNKILNYVDELNHAIGISYHKPNKCVIFQRRGVFIAELEPERDIDWEEAIKNVESVPCVPVEANEPLYILYTSGTTGAAYYVTRKDSIWFCSSGEPKGVQRPVGGHLATLAYTMKTLYAMGPNDVWWSTSDFGWVVGHSYMCYGPLVYGITSIIYEGKPTTTPDPSSYYRIISEYKVNAMFTVPTALRILREVDPEAKFGAEYDISSLRQIWVAGEHLDMSAKLWAEKLFMLLKDGSLADVNELGRIVVKLPLPPGTLTTLYKADDRFHKTYFTRHSSRRYNQCGWTSAIHFSHRKHRAFPSRHMQCLCGFSARQNQKRSAVVLVCNERRLVIFARINPFEVDLMLFEDAILNEYLIAQELIALVREHMGPVASFRLAVGVKALPTTRSGKLCRKSIADLARNKMKKVPSTVMDPTVYKEIEEALRKIGF